MNNATINYRPIETSSEYDTIVQLRNKFMSPSLRTFQAYAKPVVMQRGQGQYLWDVQDKKYVDLMAQNLCISVGYNHPLVTREAKNQIEQLRGQLTELLGRVDVASRAKGALQSEQTQLQASLHEAQSQLRKQEVEIATREGEYNVLQNSLRVLHQKIDTVVYEIQSLGGQDREGKEKREGLAVAHSELEKRDEELQSSVQTLNTGLEDMRQGRDAARLRAIAGAGCSSPGPLSRSR